MTLAPCRQRGFVTFHRLVVNIEDAARAAFTAAIGGVGLDRSDRWRVWRGSWRELIGRHAGILPQLGAYAVQTATVRESQCCADLCAALIPLDARGPFVVGTT